MVNVLVTGANGQLANCIKDLAPNHSNLNFIYSDYLELDICNLKQVNDFFKGQDSIDYCINCAAYTAVDKAEDEEEEAYNINVIGPKNLSLVCKKYDTTLIHVSTDFVFDGKKTEPYTEKDETSPISVYGETKLKGEFEIEKILKKYFIIRTSWLYSEHGNNFMKTMLRLSKEINKLSVVNDQIGTPTYARDLAEVILEIINSNISVYGLYHYSNLGQTSWYNFAKAIFQESQIEIELKPIKTVDYKTKAERPMYSVLSKSKIEGSFNIVIPDWRESLKKVIIGNF